MTDMTAVVAKAHELNNDIFEVHKALKRVASTKCRLKKMPSRSDYQANMTAALQEEQLLKNVRSYLSVRKPTIFELSDEEISAMDYTAVTRAIRSVQSKKVHTRWAEDCEKDEYGCPVPGTGEQYKAACELEQKLIDRREVVKPHDGLISATALQAFIDDLKVCKDLSAADYIDKMEAFINERS